MTCLASCNNSILHGVWIDATQNVEDIQGQISAMLRASSIRGPEQYAIHDYEGFEEVAIGEYQGIDSVVKIAAFIEERGTLGSKLINHFGDVKGAQEALDNQYAGEYTSLEEFARELTEETTDIPQHLAFYIDYGAMTRDLKMSDVIIIETSVEQVHVIWSH